jgi:NADH-quinone oxidoreductase subunit D
MTSTESPHLTDEGAQEMAPRPIAGGIEVLREVGSVLRMSEAEAAEDAPDDAESTIINMGPQHPSTHGVLRLMLELEGETVLRT